MPALKWSAAALALALAGPALAQAPVAPRDPNMPSPQTVPPEKIRPEGAEPGATGSTGSTSGNLSDRLNQSGGVLTPGDTGDSGIVATPPDTGTTPVIRPPSVQGDAPAKPQ
jgi:hypothetical protein